MAERRTWWRAFALVLLATLAWSSGIPLLTGPDESSQVVRAAGVVRGDAIGRPVPGTDNFFVEVSAPAGYEIADEAGGCYLGEAHIDIVGERRDRSRFWECPRVSDLGEDSVQETYQHRGQPLYYAVVGVASLPWGGEHGLVLMRVIAAVVCSAFIASALTSVRHMLDPGIGALAVAAAITPTCLYLAAIVNPSGLEVAAALAAWASAGAVVAGPAAPSRRLVARLGVALAVVALARGLGPVFALVIVVAAVVVADPDRRRGLAARRDVRAWGAVVAVSLAVSALWLAWLARDYPVPARQGSGLVDAVGQLGWFGRSMVAVFGTTDVVPPALLPVTWAAVAIAVLVLAARRMRRRDLGVALVLLAAGPLMLVSGQGLSVPDTGYWWQGRYVLPFAIGGLVMAGATAGRRPPAAHATTRVRPAGIDHRVRTVLLAILAVCHVWAFAYTLRHYGVGYDGTLRPFTVLFDPYWSPIVGTTWLWFGCLTVAVALLARAGGRADGAPVAPDHPPSTSSGVEQVAVDAGGRQ